MFLAHFDPKNAPKCYTWLESYGSTLYFSHPVKRQIFDDTPGQTFYMTWWPNFESICNKSEMHTGGQVCYFCRWHHLVAFLYCNARSADCWPNLQAMQVAPFGGQIYYNTRCTTWWSNLEPIQITAPYNWFQSEKIFKTQYPGSVVPLAIIISCLQENEKIFCVDDKVPLSPPRYL